MDRKTSILLQAIIELLVVQEDLLHNRTALAVRFYLLLPVEEYLPPKMQVTAGTALGPIAN